MFAVFARTTDEDEVSGRGHTPQMAWETMLQDYHIDEDDIDSDTVEFFKVTEVTRETKFVWVESDN